MASRAVNIPLVSLSRKINFWARESQPKSYKSFFLFFFLSFFLITIFIIKKHGIKCMCQLISANMSVEDIRDMIR